LDDGLRRLGLLGDLESASWVPLTGGVSSDIWRVDLPNDVVCVKRARPVLAVAAEWNAPVERNDSEVAWLQVAGNVCPNAVPRVLGQLLDEHLFVMEFLDTERFPVWKNELAAGRVDEELAHRMGASIGSIHSHTAGDPAIAEQFATDALFHSLRLEPYFEATAATHSDDPEIAQILLELAERTATTKLALVHGDVSPKNVLSGPDGPVLLDAECAWYGDPAFDVAFCLTHLLLKCLWVPSKSADYLRSARAFASAHAELIDWEQPEGFDDRVATLIPALLLARIDGKSPVEYLTDRIDQEAVRAFASELLLKPEHSTEAVFNAWQRSLPSE
jgi:aminoglycoside phosphotransferase (APT) family kinase protein